MVGTVTFYLCDKIPQPEQLSKDRVCFGSRSQLVAFPDGGAEAEQQKQLRLQEGESTLGKAWAS